MTTSLKISFLVVLLLLFLSIGSATLCYFEVGARKAEDFSRERLLSLRPGMTEAEVIQSLGPPLAREKSPSADQMIWTYAEPGYCLEGLEAYVFMTRGHLVSAKVEHFDLGIYRCDASDCPEILDSETFERIFRDQ